MHSVLVEGLLLLVIKSVEFLLMRSRSILAIFLVRLVKVMVLLPILHERGVASALTMLLHMCC